MALLPRKKTKTVKTVKSAKTVKTVKVAKKEPLKKAQGKTSVKKVVTKLVAATLKLKRVPVVKRSAPVLSDLKKVPVVAPSAPVLSYSKRAPVIKRPVPVLLKKQLSVPAPEAVVLPPKVETRVYQEMPRDPVLYLRLRLNF